ncbi:Ig-like domain repeat protein [Granulicella aggregans]|uniref:Ig-like domain repeat protein n=1 Tax=Granulicella aggregans TaxID=474949 RepID=UPI0021E0FA3C|nr:Ig-like domain repeat protein [Granulicella aggregans]
MPTSYGTKFSALVLGLGACIGTIAAAQTFTPPAAATSSRTTPYSDLSASQALAVDSSGDIFFSRPGSGILAEKPANGGAEITLYTAPSGGGGYPKGVAANDTYAYLTDYAGHLWQVAIAGGAATDLLPACNSIDGYYLGTQVVATDGLGNVYTAGNNETALFKITSADVCSVVSGATLDANSHIAADAVGDLAYSTGGTLYSLPAGATSPIAVTATFNSIIGLRSDAAGNVFVTTYSGIVEVPFIHGALDGAAAFTVLAGSSQSDVAVAQDGTIYTTDGTNLFKNLIGNLRFAATTVGTASTAQTVNVIFSSTQTLSGLRYTSGVETSAEIANAGSGSCAVGQSYAEGAACTINLTFTPASIGARNGAVVLSSTAGTIGTVAIVGQGSGPGLTADPGTQTALGSGWQLPSGIAVDPNGAVFVTDKTAGTLSLIEAGSTTPQVIATGLSQPVAAAVAADGTAYVATSAGNLVKVPYSGTAYGTPITVSTGFTSPSAMTVGPDGSLYVANTGAGTVVRIPNQGGALNFSDQTAVGSGFTSPAGLAFDSTGNLFVADSGAGSIFEVRTGTTNMVVTGLTSPTAIAVDDSESLYVLESGVPTVLRIAYTNGSYNTNATTALGNGFTTPVALAADSAGNLYLVDSGGPAVASIQRTAGSLNLGRINTGSSSTAQSLSLSNDGDTALTFGSPLYVASGNTSDFTVTTPTSSGCASGTSLAAGGTCAIAGVFAPTATGPLTETLTLASNAANASSITGAFTGTGINLPKTNLTLVTNPVGRVTYGTSVTATATVAAPAGSTGAPTGTVTFLVNGTPYQTVSLASGGASAVITGLPAGSNRIDATYSGDTNFAASAGNSQTIVVTLAPTATSFTSSISSAAAVPPGTSVVLTATVTSAVTSSKPTGAVNFISNGTVVASAVVNTSTGIASVSTSTLPLGTYSILAIYNGDSGFASSSSAAIAVSIRSQQYDVVNPPGTLSVTAPGSVSGTFAIAPISGYVGGVDMACSGLPANTRCTFLPATVAFSAASSSPQNVTLTVTTGTPPPTTVAAWIFPLTGILLLGVWRKRRSLAVKHVRLFRIAAILLSGVALFSATGCGSSGVSTPAGSSTVTVTLTGTPNGTTTIPANGAGEITKSFTFMLDVQ